MLLRSVELRRHTEAGDDAAALPPRAADAGRLLRRIAHMCLDSGQAEPESQGNTGRHSNAGASVMPDLLQAGTAATRAGITVSRPVSLGEVLGWSAARKSNLALSCASAFPDLHSSACTATGHTVLSAWPGERFVLRHGDNYGHVQMRRGDGTWESVAAVADYMPAGAGRRYLREVGNAHGEFQLRLNGTWVSESAHGRQVRLYLIEGRFEMLTDEQHARRG